MKKVLSFALAMLTVLATFASCAPAADQLDPAITLASSDAEKYADWLDERLDTIPDHVIIGVGSNEKYGVDMTNFDSDGYIARAENGTAVLFGATADGLDRAVREYAQAADNGATAELDTVFGEGPRIEKLTIGGNGIADFTVVYRYDGGKATINVDGYTVENASLAAEEFIRLMKKATGVTLTAVPHTEKVSGPMIMFDYLPEDEGWGDRSYTYEVKDGNLYITGAKKTDGCISGVYGFFEYECGWNGLIIGDSRLEETENLDIPNGTSYSADPMFDYLQLGWGWKLMTNKYTNERSRVYTGAIVHSSHGIESYYGFDDGLVWPEGGICYTDEDTYDLYYNGFKTVVESKKASGLTIGEDWLYQDIGHPDGDHYCKCQTCKNVYRKEGNANSGLTIYFANKVAAQMESENFGGLKWLVMAYCGSNKPCKTAPREDVWVTLCTDGACVNHPLSGEDCTGDTLDEKQLLYAPEGGVYAITDRTNNSHFADWIRGWRELTDSLYIWHYGLCTTTYNYTQFDYLYHEWMFLKECGVKGVYFEQEYGGTGFGRIRFQLISWLYWHPDATEEEYNAARAEIMANEYGEGWDLVLDTIGLWRETESTVGCFHCWMFTDHFRLGTYDTEIFAKNANQMYELLDIARKKASCYQQDKNIALLQMEVAYRQCMCSYFKAEAMEDSETLAFLNTRYEQFKSLAAYCGLDIKSFGYGYYMGPTYLSDTLEGAAANEWAGFKDELTPDDVESIYKHVVIIGVDGAGAYWEEANYPAFKSIFGEGASTVKCRVENPTDSIANWPSMLTGVNPQTHKAAYTTYESEEPYSNSRYPTVFKMLREAHPYKSHASIVNWNSINTDAIEEGIGVVKQTAGSDRAVTDLVVNYLSENKPELLFVQFDEVDGAGHDEGYGSAAFENAIYNEDEYLGMVYDALTENGMIEETLFILTSDHGHIYFGGHDGQSDTEKYIGFYAAGKTVIPNGKIGKMYNRDLAAIVMHALGVDGNTANWDSCVPSGLFADYTEGDVRDESTSTKGHETEETPAGKNSLENYIDTSKLEAALFFDGDIEDEYGDVSVELTGSETYTDGFYGQAISLNNTSYITLPDQTFGTDSFTVGLWLKHEVFYTGNEQSGLFGNKSFTEDEAEGFLFRYIYDADLNMGNGTQYQRVGLGLPDDYDKRTWHHILLRVDRKEGNVSVYYDFEYRCEYQISDYLDGVSFDSENPFVLGADGVGNEGFKGQIDDFMIFDGALTDEEIASLCGYYFK